MEALARGRAPRLQLCRPHRAGSDRARHGPKGRAPADPRRLTLACRASLSLPSKLAVNTRLTILANAERIAVAEAPTWTTRINPQDWRSGLSTCASRTITLSRNA